MDTKEFLSHDQFAQHIGTELIEVGDNTSKARMLVDDQHLNGNGVCQGGAIFALGDFALAAAFNSHEKNAVSVNASVAFINPAPKGWLYADARVVVDHHRLPYGEVRITHENGQTVAVITSSAYRKRM